MALTLGLLTLAAALAQLAVLLRNRPRVATPDAVAADAVAPSP